MFCFKIMQTTLEMCFIHFSLSSVVSYTEAKRVFNLLKKDEDIFHVSWAEWRDFAFSFSFELWCTYKLFSDTEWFFLIILIDENHSLQSFILQSWLMIIFFVIVISDDLKEVGKEENEGFWGFLIFSLK